MKKLYFFISLILFFQSILTSGGVKAQVNENDSLVLVELYNSTNGDYWLNNSNWLVSPVSEWFGVTINNGQIEAIELPENNLDGTIPFSIGNLYNLVRLVLGGNNLTGEIPSTLGNLYSLQILRLSNNLLTGDIPYALGDLFNLLELDFRSNMLSGNVPNSLGNLYNLWYMDLARNNFSGELPQSFENLTSLTILYLGENSLTGTIPLLLRTLTNIERVWLSNNNFFGIIPEWLGELSHLDGLNLDYNSFTGSIPESLGNLTNLRSLTLGNNLLTGQLPNSIGGLTLLGYLDVQNNQLAGSLPDIGTLLNLSYLYLNNNNFTGQIPSSFKNLTNLYDCYLNDNHFEGNVPDIRNWYRIHRLYLHNNKFSTLPLLNISSPYFYQLWVHNNYLSFEDILPNISSLTSFTPQLSQNLENDYRCDSVSLNLKIDSLLTSNVYNWYKDDQLIKVSNDNFLTIPKISENQGIYRCLVTNPELPSLTINSTKDTLIINELNIISQPTNQTVCADTEVQFTSKAHSPYLSYQWELDKGDSIWTDIDGAIDTSLIIKADISKSNYRFRCSITDTCGKQIRSAAALLTVHPLPVIASSSPSDTICEGTPLALNVSATDTSGAALTYQWQKYIPNQWENIDGQTSTVLNLTAQPEINKAYYRCVVTGLCSVNSEPAQISVTNAPAIVTQPADFSVCQGAMAGFSVNATGLDSTYQWQYSADNGSSWNDIAGANHFYFETDGTSSVNANLYRCRVSGSCGNSATSNAARLTLIANPALTSQPVAQSVVEGDQASFAVSATGTNLTYQWQNNLTGNWTDIQEATESTLNFSASLSNAADYRCMVNNLCASNPASLIVAAKPNITKQPVDQTVVEGTTATFNIVASGYDLAYQWQKYEGGTWNNVQTATSKVYKVQALPAQEGEYRCVITNSENVTVNSSSAWLRRCTTPTIETQPLNQTVCEGSDVTFSVSALEPSRFQWQVKPGGSNVWGNIPLATDAGYSFTVQAASNGNAYRCLLTRTCGSSATSEVAVLTSGNTMITKQPSGLALCDGDQARFSVHASGLNISYQWQQFGTTWNNITGATDSTYTTTVNTSSHRKQFRCVVTGTCGTRTSNNALLTRGPQVINTLADQSSCNGGTATFGNIIAKGSGILNYQWQKSTNQGQTWTNITGANATSYPMAVTNADNGNVYRCIVSGICGTADTSNFAALVLKNTQIESQPLNATICEGNPTELGVKVSGLDLTYQWSQSANGTTWTDIDGAVDDSLHLPVTNSMNGYKFICKVKGRCDVNWISSGIASLATIANTLSQPEVTVGPVTCEGGENNGAITTVTPTGGQSPYSYKWSNGDTTQNLTALPVGQYTLTVNDINGCRRSVSKTVAYDAPISGNIAVTDVSIPGTAGGTIDPGITGGHQPLTYQWSNGFTDSIARGLVAGNYSLTVTDNANCTKTFSAIVNEQGAIAYMDTSNLPDPETRQLDKTLSVGTIAGEAGVSPSGAATYTIPIETLPGVGGMVPQLSLVYNSQAGNGIMGWGWNLGGLSAVTRIPRTIYNNKVAAGFTYDYEDFFALDGNRLIPINGENGRDGTVYASENETFSKIVSRGYGSSTGPNWWEVINKSKVTYKYGSTGHNLIGARTLHQDAVLSWNLDSVKDLYGNYIAYNFQQVGRKSFITRIDYGNRNGSINTVEFSYSKREDKIKVHYGVALDSIDLILNKITVKHSGELYRVYNFKYCQDDFSRLAEITQSTGKGERYNSTLFKWGTNESPLKSSHTSVGALNETLVKNRYFTTGDLNGDGLSDIISFPYNCMTMGGTAFYATKIPSDTVKFVKAFDFTIPTNKITNTIVNSKAREEIVSVGGNESGDYNGDGVTDILAPYWDNKYGSKANFQFISYDTIYGIEHKTIGKNLLATSEMPLYAFEDINNDGKDEILFIEKGTKDNLNYPGKLYLHDDLSPKWVNLNIYQSSEKPKNMCVLDFDGDGMKDIMIINSKGYRIYGNNKGSFSANVYSEGNNFNSNDYSFRIGDFNSDGLPDLILNKKGADAGNWFLALNKNDYANNARFEIIPLSITNPYDDKNTGKDDDKDNCIVTDFDNDGKSDLIIMDAHYNWKSNWFESWKVFSYFATYWYKSTGRGFELVNSVISKNEEDAYMKDYIVGDFSGNGRIDLVNFGFDCSNGENERRWRRYSVPNLNNETGVITSISNGLNQKTKLVYKSLTDRQVYRKTQKLNYPVSTFVAPIYVVDSLMTDNGLNGFNVVTTRYEDAILHKQGKGFLGFRKMTQVNHTNNSKVISTSKINLDYFTISSQVVESIFEKDTISKKIDTYKVKPISGVHIFTSIEKTETKDLLKNINTSTSFTYDDKGNLTSEKLLVNTDFNIIEKIYSTFDDFGNPASISVKATRKNETPFTESKSFTYNNKGQISTSMVNGLKTQFFYDSFGNPDSIIKGEGDTSRMIVNKFSNDGRFAESERNVLGHTSLAKWDNVGNPLRKTDINGLSTDYTYDSWGKLTESLTPENIRLKQSLEWAKANDVDAPKRALYLINNTKDDLFNGSEYYDALGRVVRKVTVGYGGAKFYTDSKYNEKGELVELSQSYPAGTITDKKTIFTYDKLGRTKTETLINGVVKTFNYDDNNRKIIISLSTGEISTKTHDPVGLVIEAIDPGGTIEYVYNSAGKPRLVQSPGSRIEIKYDAYGRQDTLIDPNAGTISYTYNVFGELVSQIGANGEKTSVKYDRLGRVIEKKVNNVLTNYRYDEGLKSLGTTSKITRKDGAGTSFKYSDDGFCRLLNKTNKYGTDSFIYQYDYDTKGRVKKEIYPSGFSVQYTYTEYDDLQELKNANGKTIWKVDEVNSQNGMLKKATFGNGKQITYGYDNDDRLNKISVPQLIDFNYQFNNKQQLDWREEKYYFADSAKWKGFKEEFTYDEVNRLKTATGGLSLNMEYDQNKIFHKSDAGTYSYQDGNHRLDELTTITGYIPPQHNLTFTKEGKVDSLLETRDSANVRLLTFKYGVDNERFSMQYKVNDTLKYTRFYFGNYEEELSILGTERNLNYIYANGDLVGIYEHKNQKGTMHYVYTDYLGSIRCITDSLGTSEKTLGFDAWGNRRNPITGIPDTSDYKNSLTARGYTGHEHLDELGLINMNGRVYDPRLGMFISPDNFVQAPDFTQNFNRFSYCLNNPLMYTDPSGEIFWAPIIAGAVMGGMINGVTAHARGGDFFDAAWKGVVVGAVGGLLSNVGGGSLVNNIMFGGLEGTVTGGLSAYLNNGDIGKGMLWGAATGIGFATANTGFEAYGNYKNGLGFRTNDGVIRNLIKDNQQQRAIDFIVDKYGMRTDSHGYSVKYYYQEDLEVYAQTQPFDLIIGDPLRNTESLIRAKGIYISSKAFESLSLLKAAVVHEWGHWLDRIVINGEFIDYLHPKYAYKSKYWFPGLDDEYAKLYEDNTIGYAQHIYNSGKLHIYGDALKSGRLNPLWKEWNGTSKWLYTIPQRFVTPVKIKDFAL